MIISVYKKKGPTSRDVINILKKNIKKKKIGHCGTLDPLAEGVLVVGIGRESTKKLHSDIFNEKEYLAVIFLGEESSTGDREGEKKKNKVSQIPRVVNIEESLKNFLGTITQIPPAFSAVKIDGKESYKWARKGIIKERKERKVEIKEIKILNYRYPFLKMKVVTGKGVYIRALAEDLGKKLGCGGYLFSLIRTRVGMFGLKDCVHLSDVEKLLK
jgi:tRNA pseudouridine55 synthase